MTINKYIVLPFMTELTTCSIWTEPVNEKLFTWFCFIISTHFSVANIIQSMSKCTLNYIYINDSFIIIYIVPILTISIHFPVMTYFSFPFCFEIVLIATSFFLPSFYSFLTRRICLFLR